MKLNKLSIILAFIFTSIVLMSFQRKEIEKDVRCRMESIPMQMLNIEVFHKYISYLYSDGKYEEEIAKTVEQAKSYIETTSETYKNKNRSIVFDLDETLLSNFNEIKKMKFAVDWNKINYDSCTLIKPTFDLYKYAIENNISVILITARNEKNRKVTVNNLKRLGINKWDTLFFMPKDMEWSEEGSLFYKIDSRKAMYNNGYNIILSIGDKMGDLKGGFCDTTFKLINLLY